MSQKKGNRAKTGAAQKSDRVQLTHHYTTLPNYIIRDETLSIAARGMLALIVSMSDDWRFYRDHMMKLSKCGKAKYYSILDELKSSGRLHIEDARNDTGTFGGRIWHVDLSPCPENRDTVDCDKNAPCPDLPDTENTDGGKTETHKKKNLNKKTNQKDRDDLFDQFLKVYPKPSNPVRSRMAFDKAIATGVPVSDIIRAAEMYAIQVKDTDRRYVTGSHGWLEGRCWEDQLRNDAPAEGVEDQVKQGWIKAIASGNQGLAKYCSAATAHELIEAGSVTRAQCVAVGIL